MVRVLFRADSSIEIGSGHLMRCLTLANELRKRGAEISFICRELKGNIIGKLENEGYFVFKLPSLVEVSFHSAGHYSAWLGVTQEEDAEQTLNAVSHQCYEWIIIDHYALDVIWEKKIRSRVKKIMVIDDLANRKHECDLLLDQNYFGEKTISRYEHLIPNFCQYLLGPKYALLQPEYKHFRNVLPLHNGLVNRLLIFFGSSDLQNHTAEILKVLNSKKYTHLCIDVVIGGNHPDPDGIMELVQARPNTFLYKNLRSLAGLMARADLMVGAGGATTWERMCLGLPSIVISIAENQQEQTRILTNEHFQISPNINKKIQWEQAIYQLQNDCNRVKKLSGKAKLLVDGLGSLRVSRIIAGSEKLNLKIRKAHQLDEEILFAWVNEACVRKNSFCKDSISKDQHAKWFRERLVSPNCHILIGEDESGLPLGQVRIDINRKEKEGFIDISIDVAFRGVGISKLLLDKAVKYIHSTEPDIKLIAEVAETNEQSCRLFTSLLFTKISSRRLNAHTYELSF